MATDPNGNIQHNLNPVLGWIRMDVHTATGVDPLTAPEGSLRGQTIEVDLEKLAAMARKLKLALDEIER